MLTSVRLEGKPDKSSWRHQPESVHQPAAVFDLCRPSAFQQFGAKLISCFSLSFVNLWIGALSCYSNAPTQRMLSGSLFME